MYLSQCVAGKTPDSPLTPPNWLPHPNPPKAKYKITRAHAPTQPPLHTKTMMIVDTEDNRNFAWSS